MAEVSKHNVLSKRGTYSTKYSGAWFDGRAWEFKEGKDFPKGQVEQFRARLRAAAWRRGVPIVTAVVNGTTVVMQAKKEEEPNPQPQA